MRTVSGAGVAFCALASCVVLATAGGRLAANAGQAGEGSALAAGNLGLYAAADFRLATGACTDCPAPRQALWYFQDDVVAVPKPNVVVATYTRGLPAPEDVRRWYERSTLADMQARPPLIWIGAPDLVADARFVAGEDAVRLTDGSTVRFELTPKIASNRSYYDASTAAFFRDRALRIRGRVAPGAPGRRRLVARTIWPQDHPIDAVALGLAPLAVGERLASLVRRTGAAERRYETRLLWERHPGQARDWRKLAALGVMLNGAQGDDDEAHGGHFAIVTGRYDGRGEWADWLVNNFYDLDSFSEKGIIGSVVPMDNYLNDLNSGQSYYRPSYMLVALLRDDRAAYAYQSAANRVYQHFYRHDFRYRHASANCAGISLDTLRAVGWSIPTRGATSRARALVAYPYMAVKEMSLESGRKYLKEEQTRLYPAVAFDAVGDDLLKLAGVAPVGRAAASPFERWLQSDLEAIVFVRIPQLPSSRAVGTFPVASIDEYLRRVPEDRAQWKVVPVDPRPFPDEFKDEYTEPAEPTSLVPAVVAGMVFLGGALTVRAVRRRRARGR